MSDSFNKKSDHILSHMKEQVKIHVIYDGNQRQHLIYTAKRDAKNGDPCMVTEYVYDGITTRCTGFKENDAAWNSAWDADFTI